MRKETHGVGLCVREFAYEKVMYQTAMPTTLTRMAEPNRSRTKSLFRFGPLLIA